ncbi:MAG: DUF134 domain-containing protein [Bacteroidales bacterium]|nr:DUF134 domain-containing protein [Bacteroidales bacterium]MCF8390811.1 DUF134 domain-containing protein [Bacteroidales bacterium]
MARKKHLRKIVSPPRFKSFKPIGVTGRETGSVDLLYEEYEAIKLADYDLLSHKEASALMDVSRATFARIYESARRKISMALVEIKEIKAVFGNVTIDESWSFCNNCSARFTLNTDNGNKRCAFCGSVNIKLGVNK